MLKLSAAILMRCSCNEREREKAKKKPNVATRTQTNLFLVQRTYYLNKFECKFHKFSNDAHKIEKESSVSNIIIIVIVMATANKHEMREPYSTRTNNK